ncbi:protein EMSY-LIKE 3 [Lactuca sativa]|uniref:protein EMSY-LIKE 3 n=1 Tax=Lactuca sativa TaxID=4236 RepID=UPI001C6876A6|nr:protein EMSY-LIKE 3 [Lactuca sativa]
MKMILGTGKPKHVSPLAVWWWWSDNGTKGKNKKYCGDGGQIMGGGSSLKMQYPPSGPSGWGQLGNRVTSGPVANKSAETSAFSPLIGRKVRTRWPDDNNFYEAVITDHNPVEGRHALVYDISTANETWEWVNLISREDIQWWIRYSVHGMSRPVGRDNGPGGGGGAGRGRGLPKSQAAAASIKDFPRSQNGIGKKGRDNIQSLHTDTLIKEVERVFGSSHPDPVEIQKTKKVLKEHEQELTDGIARLAYISDGESGDLVKMAMVNTNGPNHLPSFGQLIGNLTQDIPLLSVNITFN